MDYLYQLSDGLISKATLHPLLVHFPIVLFFVFIFLYALNIYSQKLVSNGINLGILLVLLILGLVAKYTGENAGIEAGPTLTNPRVLTNHASHAINFIRGIATLLFTFVLVEFYLIRKSIIKGKAIIVGRVIIFLIAIFTSVLLTQTGHSGAILVYKYAAGVDIPLRRAEKVIQGDR